MENMRNIEFDGKFDALLCLDGTLPGVGKITGLGNLPILAADGAAIRRMEMGIKPDYIIGDLDTFGAHPFSKNKIDSVIIEDKSQEINDFEKSLVFALSRGFLNILIMGMHGGELEHTLNNWSVLIKFSKKLTLTFYEDERYGLPLDYPARFKVFNGEMVSLIPQPVARLTTRNLFWELNNEYLRLGEREGSRNIATGEIVEIGLHEGSLFVFISSRYPNAPVVKQES